MWNARAQGLVVACAAALGCGSFTPETGPLNPSTCVPAEADAGSAGAYGDAGAATTPYGYDASGGGACADAGTPTTPYAG